ncbi:MAG: hypothetical protein Q9163_002210 [Psora crenata]
MESSVGLAMEVAMDAVISPRTATCKFEDLKQIAERNSESLICLQGYLGERSDLSKRLSFVPLNDPTQKWQIQVVSVPSKDKPEETLVHEQLKSIKANSPVFVKGWLRPRRDNSKSGGQGYEKDLSSLEITITGSEGRILSLNDFPSDIIMKKGTQFPPEQRHLQLRKDDDLRYALRMRCEIQNWCSLRLSAGLGAVGIETPILFKSTPEGAREFLVPTRRKGYAYALPQSPQQFKQLLMVSGIHRYFQFARCFRDEDLRADRQPEFTQLDVEMSFASGEDVMVSIERDLIVPLLRQFLEVEIDGRFPRLTYAEAISRHGSDKPDLRLPIQPFFSLGYLLPADLISMITPLGDPVIEAMVVPMECSAGESRQFISRYFELWEGRSFTGNPDGAPGVFIYDSSKPLQGLSAFGFEAVENVERQFELQDGYLIILQARKDAAYSGGCTALGSMRNSIFNAAVRQGHLHAPGWTDFKPLWVTDFPLFSPPDPMEPGQGGKAGFDSTHHPFTSPKTPEDVNMLVIDPSRVIGDHYDLVINGEEVGGGSRRIHHAAMQNFIFREVLQMDDGKVAEFAHLLEALRAGCPPHAGIALGFDRLVAMMVSCKLQKKMTMRDVIAFPKSGKGDDLMVKSPGLMSDDALKTYHLKLDN